MSRLQIGIHAPFLNYDFYDDEQIRMVELIDRIGYAAIWVRDVPLHSPIFLQNPDQIYEPFTYLSFIAAYTKKIKLGTAAIVLGERQPVLVAKMAASLDRLSKGRLILGVGSGDRPDEFEAFGLDYEGRYERTKESITLIRSLWTNQPIYMSGRFGSISGQSMAPPPYEKGGPPIWIVGNAGQTPEWIAQHADGWFYHSKQHSAELIASVRHNSPPGKYVSTAFSTNVELLPWDRPLMKFPGGMAGGSKALLEELKKYQSWGLDYFSIKKFVGNRPEEEQIIQFAEEVLHFL